jgi:hypothetical protein
VSGDQREELGLHIDDEEGGVVAVHELGRAEERHIGRHGIGRG